VLDAALEVFSRGGYAAASMAAIAEEAQISKAVVYDCFPGGKEALFYALLERTEQDFVGYLDEHWSGLSGREFEETLRVGLDAFLGYAEHDPAAFRVIFGDVGASEPAIQRRATAVRTTIIDRFTDGAVASLGLAPELRPAAELYARMLVSCAEELARWLAEGAPLARELMVSLAVAFLMQGFSGVMPPRP